MYFKGGSTELPIPAIEELRKDLPHIAYDRSVSLLGTPLSQPPTKRRLTINTPQKLFLTADTDSDDNIRQTNSINNNINRNTLIIRNSMMINPSGNASL